MAIMIYCCNTALTMGNWVAQLEADRAEIIYNSAPTIPENADVSRLIVKGGNDPHVISSDELPLETEQFIVIVRE